MPSSEAGGHAASGLERDPPQPFVLHPGDVVTVTVVSAEGGEYPDLVVDDAGQVHLPLIGAIEVGGLDMAESAERIQTELRQYDRFAEVTVILVEPAGHQATVQGAVGTPGSIQLRPGMRIASLVAAAGGPLTHSDDRGVHMPVANLEGAVLYRNGEQLPLRLSLALTGDPGHNVRVHPGDHLYIPSQSPISVLGEVNAATEVPHRPGLRLTDALAAAGGPTRDAEGDDVRLIRGSPESPEVYEANVEAIAEGKSHDVVLQPGDVVYVSGSGRARLRDVLLSISPLLSAAVSAAVTAAIITTTD